MTTSTTKPHKGEIWEVRFDPSEGDEVQKIRPAVVVNENEIGKLDLSIVVPVIDWKERYSEYVWFVCLVPNAQNGLSKVSGADGFQVKSVGAVKLSREAP
ncbi:MAG: type II toxin-antitoxin system PemK/MazF family toxin [Salinibacter sp.]